MSSTERTARPPIDRAIHRRITAQRDAKQATVGRVRRVTINEILADWADWYDATADMRRLGISGIALRDLLAPAGDTE